ncbi:recombinase, partial [Clostridioides difficile]|nr:recombinase [Clostridioides difficile]
METNNVYIKLVNIQSTLKAPKSQFNSFGKYNYRSCEDILEGLKPILKEEKALVILDDKVVQIGTRFYVEATATLIDAETGEKVSAKALAREDETKKGMDLAQVTGSVSSYARKYALNGLFCIDDTKDSDATNTHGKEQKKREVSEDELSTLYFLGESIDKDKNRVDSEVYKKFSKLA